MQICSGKPTSEIKILKKLVIELGFAKKVSSADDILLIGVEEFSLLVVGIVCWIFVIVVLIFQY